MEIQRNKKIELILPEQLLLTFQVWIYLSHAEESLHSIPICACGCVQHQGLDQKFSGLAFELRPRDGITYTIGKKNGFPSVCVSGGAGALPIIFKTSGSCLNKLHGESNK